MRAGGGCTGRGCPSRGCSRECDFGDGPAIGPAETVLFCFWLAWSRFRVIVPLLDRTWPSVAGGIDVALRRAGGVPTYLLTDNEKTVRSPSSMWPGCRCATRPRWSWAGITG